MKKRIKINGIVIFVSIIIIVFFAYKLLRQEETLMDDFLEIVGISSILMGQLLRVSSRGYKSENSNSGHSLITDGPYSAVRNPMYLGIILIGLGVVLFVFKPWVFIIFILVFFSLYAHLIAKEEKILLKVFGQRYLEYKKKVPQLFPRPWFLLKTDVQKYLPLRLGWLKREATSIILVLFSVLLVEAWEIVKIQGWHVLIVELFKFAIIIMVFFILVIFLAQRYENLAKENKNHK
jgi:protein-S-isoprenylcysteine O-methyltransferase Ste14